MSFAKHRSPGFRHSVILAACVWFLGSALAFGYQYVAANDTRIKFLGTWRPWENTFYSLYPGSTVRIKVQGSARIDLGLYDNDPPRVRVRRLGQDGGTIYNVNDQIWLTATSGPVEFEIVFIAMNGTPNNTASSVWVKGLWLSDGSTLLDATAPDGRLRVEFLGDSITHGVRILQSSGSNLYSMDASQCYGYYVARALHAPYRVRGHSGISTDDVIGMVGYFSSGVALSPTPAPDYFFINIGANDVNQSSAWFRQNLSDLLSTVRNRFPSSYIYVLDFFNQNPNRVSDIHSAIANRAAGHASFFDAARYISSMPDNIHPTGSSHAALALALARLIGPGPTLAAPVAGSVVSKRPELIWHSMPEAQNYYLWINRDGAKYSSMTTGGATNWSSSSDMPSGYYTWWVQARNQYAELGWSAAGSCTILPYKPDTAAICGAPTGTIDPVRRPVFSWSAVDRATWYYLWISRNGVVYAREWVQGGTTWQPATDLAGGNYRWWVRAWNADGYGPWSDGGAFTISVRTPSKIVTMSPAGEQGQAAAAYTWQADRAATWYRLWVNRNGVVWHDSWHYTGVTNGTLNAIVEGHRLARYQWWMRGWGPDGYGPWSDTLAFTYGLSSPGNPTGLVQNTRSPEFTWKKTGDVAWYLLWLNRNDVFHAKQWVEGTNWTFAADLPYGTYQWWVDTWKDGIAGPWSDAAAFSIGSAMPVYPSGTLSGPPTELRWDDTGCNDATWYQLWIDWGGSTFWHKWIKREDTASGSGQERIYTGVPTFIPPFGNYSWRIQAWNSTGTGPWSDRLDFMVP